jgi:curved DNA-binding protein CbpA
MEIKEAIEILGFKKNSNFMESEVKEKFRKLAKEKHPE